MDNMKEFLKDPKNSAKLQLLLYGILVVIAIIFIRVNNMLNKNENKVNKDNVINTDKNNEVDDNENNLILSSIKDNYEYKIDMEIKTYDGVENISYSGIKYNNEELINKNKDSKEEKFYVNNGVYSKSIDGKYENVNREYVYDDINPYYLEIDNIYNYIEKGIKDEKIYLIRINKIINNSDSNEYITIEESMVDNDIILNIDYTNLLKNDNIVSFKIKYTITNINKIDDDYFNDQKVIEN